METQATFGYVQNRVTGALTDDTPPVAAIVEELFPTEAMHDIHAFYGSDGDQAELDRRMTLPDGRASRRWAPTGTSTWSPPAATLRPSLDLHSGNRVQRCTP